MRAKRIASHSILIFDFTAVFLLMQDQKHQVAIAYIRIMKHLILICTLFLSSFLLLQAQTLDTSALPELTPKDSISVNASEDQSDYEDDGPGLMIFVLAGSALISLTVGSFLFIGIVAFFAMAGLTAMGIISASMIAGLYHRSLAKGFRLFMILCCAAAGLIFGAIGFFFLNLIIHWWTNEMALLIGSGIGLISGIIFGSIAYIVFKQLIAWLKTRLQL